MFFHDAPKKAPKFIFCSSNRVMTLLAKSNHNSVDPVIREESFWKPIVTQKTQEAIGPRKWKEVEE